MNFALVSPIWLQGCMLYSPEAARAALKEDLGVFPVTLIVFSRYALLKNSSLSTMLSTVPTSWLYSVMNPHSRNQSRDLDDLFPSQKTQGSDESEELPPFRFTKANEEQRESNTEEHKN